MTDPQEKAVSQDPEASLIDVSKSGNNNKEKAPVLTFNPLQLAIEKFSKHDGEPLSIQEMFRRMLDFPVEERLQCINAFLLAKVIAEKTGSTMTIEFIKELGRNERKLLQIDQGAGGLGDDKTPWD